MLPTGDGAERLEIRNMVDDAYQKINKSMFDSLKVIAKESPTARVPGQVQGIAVQSQGVNDPEDKEALNYHILLIENMNHYMEEVDDKASIVIAEWKKRAANEMQEHMQAYVNAVIRRPLGKVLVCDPASCLLFPLRQLLITLCNIGLHGVDGTPVAKCVSI